MQPEKIGPTSNLKEVKIIIHKLELAKLDQLVFITQRFMDELPKSKYRPVDYLVKLTTESTMTPTARCDTDSAKDYSSSDDTVQYWSLDRDQELCLFPNIVLSGTQGK